MKLKGTYNMAKKIESTKTVYDHNNVKYMRVFFEGNSHFEDIEADIFNMWVEANGHQAPKTAS